MRQFVPAGTPATIEIIGCDGSSWTVSGGNEGNEGVILDSSPSGLQEAPRSGIWQQSAFQEGATYQGVSVEPIDLVLAFQIWGDESNWQDVSSRFRRAFDYEQTSTIRVSTSSGARELEVQMFEAPDRDQEHDPRILEYSVETYTLRAAFPYWLGDIVTDTATVTLYQRPVEGTEWWEKLSAALKRLLKMSPNVEQYSNMTVTVSNPTDVPLWPQWAFTAPGRWGIPDFSFKDDDQANRVIISPTLNSGQGLTVDTYPRNEPYVAADGSNAPGLFGGVLPLNPIPPFTPPTEIPISYVGNDANAAATVRLRQYWNNPWG